MRWILLLLVGGVTWCAQNSPLPKKVRTLGIDQERGYHVVVLGAFFFGELLFPESDQTPFPDKGFWDGEL